MERLKARFLHKSTPKSVAPPAISFVRGFQLDVKKVKVVPPSDRDLERSLIKESKMTARLEASDMSKHPPIYESPRAAPPIPGSFPNDPSDRGLGQYRLAPGPRSKSHRPGVSKEDIAHRPVRVIDQTFEPGARVEYIYPSQGVHHIRRRASSSDDSNHSVFPVASPPGLEQLTTIGGRIRTAPKMPRDARPSDVGVQRTGSFSRPTRDAYRHLLPATEPPAPIPTQKHTCLPLFRRKFHRSAPERPRNVVPAPAFQQSTPERPQSIAPPPVPPKDFVPMHMHHPYMYSTQADPSFSRSTPSLLPTATRRAPTPAPSAPTPPRIGGHLRPQRSQPKMPSYVHSKAPSPPVPGHPHSRPRENLPLPGFPTFPLPPGYDHFAGARLRTSSTAAREAHLVPADQHRRSMKATVEEYVPSRCPPPVPMTPPFVPAPATSAKQDRVQRVRAVTGPSSVRQVDVRRAPAEQRCAVPQGSRLPARGYTTLRVR